MSAPIHSEFHGAGGDVGAFTPPTRSTPANPISGLFCPMEGPEGGYFPDGSPEVFRELARRGESDEFISADDFIRMLDERQRARDQLG